MPLLFTVGESSTAQSPNDPADSSRTPGSQGTPLPPTSTPSDAAGKSEGKRPRKFP